MSFGLLLALQHSMALALAARNLGTVCKPAGRDLSLGDESELFIYGASRARCLTAKPREHEGHCTAGVGALLYIHQCALTNAARFGTAFCGETGYAPGCQQQQLEHC